MAEYPEPGGLSRVTANISRSECPRSSPFAVEPSTAAASRSGCRARRKSVMRRARAIRVSWSIAGDEAPALSTYAGLLLVGGERRPPVLDPRRWDFLASTLLRGLPPRLALRADHRRGGDGQGEEDHEDRDHEELGPERGHRGLEEGVPRVDGGRERGDGEGERGEGGRRDPAGHHAHQ